MQRYKNILAEMEEEHEYLGEYIDLVVSNIDIRLLVVAFRFHAFGEEASMLKSKYPDKAKHTDEHNNIIKSMGNIKINGDEEYCKTILRDTLQNHIDEFDTPLKTWLENQYTDLEKEVEDRWWGYNNNRSGATPN